MNEFNQLGLSKRMLTILADMKFSIPTEIQKETIPYILEGKDIIGNAATGSGKTLAFASGIIEKTIPRKGVQALVLTPTRELADQIAKVMNTFSKHSSLTIEKIFGGVPIERQIRGIQNAEIIIGTPGRTLDHLKRNTLNLSQLKIFVLDEADRMADMGFISDVEKILRYTPREKQMLLFSATNSPEVHYIEKKYMKHPKHVVVEKYLDVSQLQQYFYDVQRNEKFSLLVHLLKEEKSEIVMVFCNTRRTVDKLAMNLKKHGIYSQAIHGGLEQKKRSRIIESLHNKQTNVLICTDVAARGLDIKNVSHVYNYDIPPTSEEYIHRVGRTARAGEKGVAISLLSDNDYDNFRKVTRDDSLKIKQRHTPEIKILEADFKNQRFRDNENNQRGNNSRNQHRGGNSRNPHSSGGNNRFRNRGNSRPSSNFRRR